MRARIAEIAGIPRRARRREGDDQREDGLHRPRRRHRRRSPTATVRLPVERDRWPIAGAARAGASAARSLPRARSSRSPPRNPAPAGWSRRRSPRSPAPPTWSSAASSPTATRPSRRCSAFRPRSLERYGAVSRETAEAMAEGALGACAGRSCGVDHRHRRPGRRDRRASRSGSCISPPRAAARLVHREQRFGDIGRREVRRASVAGGARDAARACRDGNDPRSARELLAQDRAENVGVVVGPGRDARVGLDLLPARPRGRSPRSARLRASAATSAFILKSVGIESGRSILLDVGRRALRPRPPRRPPAPSSMCRLEMCRTSAPSRREPREIAGQRLARQQMHRNRVGRERVEHDEVIALRRCRQRQPRIAEHDRQTGRAGRYEAEEARIARDPDHLRIDLEEGPLPPCRAGGRRGCRCRARRRRRGRVRRAPRARPRCLPISVRRNSNR